MPKSTNKTEDHGGVEACVDGVTERIADSSDAGDALYVSKSDNSGDFETSSITFSINECSSELLEKEETNFVGENNQSLDNFETQTISFIQNSKSIGEMQSGQKIMNYSKFQKDKARLTKELKRSADNYTLNKASSMLEMSRICRRINNLVNGKRHISSNAPEKNSKIDRFKEYFENPGVELSKSEAKIANADIGEKDAPETDHTESHPDCLSGFSLFNEDYDRENKSDVIEDKLPEILKVLEANNVVLIKGDTGCGKSTIIPRMLMSTYKNIVCTQPRRLAAINVARKVSSDIGCKLGTAVGYSIRFEDRTSKDTKLKYVTDGVLLNELNHWKRNKITDTICTRNGHNTSCKSLNMKSKDIVSATNAKESTYSGDVAVHSDSECGKESCRIGLSEQIEIAAKNLIGDSNAIPVINGSGFDESPINGKDPAKAISSPEIQDKSKILNYDLIIIDEAHERSINIDFLLAHLKTMLKHGNVSTKVIIMSATLNTEKLIEYYDCPIVEIKQRRYDVAHFYLNNPAEDYLSASIQTAVKLVKKFPSGDIIVFLSGQEDIYRAEASLKSALSGSGISILKLFSAMPAEEQDLIFIKGSRKLILSTNVAETSITIEGIKFVVDSGKVKVKRRSSGSSIDFLEVVDISKAQAKQRAGRAGRTQPGVVFRIYTPNEYLEMKENLVPEILRTNLSSLVLTMKNFGYLDILCFDFVDKPSVTSINRSIQFLYYLKAIDKDGEITRLGKVIAKLPLDPEMGMSLLAASKIGCLDSVSTIAAFLDYHTVFLDIKSDSRDYKIYRSIKSGLSHPKGDFFTSLNIYNLWSASKFSSFFLKKNFLNFKTMHQIKKVKSQLLSIFPSQKDSSLGIEESFCSGFFMNVAKRDNKSYKTVFGNVECFIHPNDELFRKSPKYVLFYELFCVKRVYMNHCIEIDPHVLSCSVNKDYKLQLAFKFINKSFLALLFAVIMYFIY